MANCVECDRCGKQTNEWRAPLNAIPRGYNMSIPFEIMRGTWYGMKKCILCNDCVQSFFDWWKEGDGE